MLFSFTDGIDFSEARQFGLQVRDTAVFLPLKVYNAAEFFAGSASLAQGLRKRNCRTAALDILYWYDYLETRKPNPMPKGNAMDINEPAGFLRLGLSSGRCS